MDAPLLRYPDAAGLIAHHAASLSAAPAVAIERLDLAVAHARVLAAPIYADRDQPPFPRSTRDGYACRAADLSPGRALVVVGQIRAGQPAPERPLAPGQAIEIMTGAPVPQGADAVLMLEHALPAGSGSEPRTVALAPGRALLPGENVVPPASEARRNDLILSAGVRLTPSMIGAAASCGITSVDVFHRPRVAILATGDELVEGDETPLPHQVRNSNSYSLAAQVLAAGGDPLRLPIARDRRDHLDAALRHALANADLLLLSGGVSAGAYDLVEPVLADLGAEFLFTGVLIQPGKPVVFGRLPEPGRLGVSDLADHPDSSARNPKVEAGKYFFGLPGNPVSTLVTFLLFAAPVVGALGGEGDAAPRFAQAILASELRVRPGLTRFLPGRLQADSEACQVHPIRWQGSGDLAAAARANCFVVVPPDRDRVPAGATVAVLLSS
jgi:molybdopterin molybdotransferase